MHHKKILAHSPFQTSLEQLLTTSKIAFETSLFILNTLPSSTTTEPENTLHHPNNMITIFSKTNDTVSLMTGFPSEINEKKLEGKISLIIIDTTQQQITIQIGEFKSNIEKFRVALSIKKQLNLNNLQALQSTTIKNLETALVVEGLQTTSQINLTLQGPGRWEKSFYNQTITGFGIWSVAQPYNKEISKFEWAPAPHTMQYLTGSNGKVVINQSNQKTKKVITGAWVLKHNDKHSHMIGGPQKIAFYKNDVLTKELYEGQSNQGLVKFFTPGDYIIKGKWELRKKCLKNVTLSGKITAQTCWLEGNTFRLDGHGTLFTQQGYIKGTWMVSSENYLESKAAYEPTSTTTCHGCSTYWDITGKCLGIKNGRGAILRNKYPHTELLEGTWINNQFHTSSPFMDHQNRFIVGKSVWNLDGNLIQIVENYASVPSHYVFK